MKAYLSLLLTSALIFGAASMALGDSSKSENSGSRSSSGHRSHSNSHHHSTGSRHSSGSSGSKTHSNVPSN